MIDIEALGFHAIAENSVDGILVLDDQGVILYCNPAALRLLNFGQNNPVGELFGFPAVAGESTDLDIFGRDGKKYVEMRVAETFCCNNNKAYIASLRDITERKKMEEDLFQARKMEAIGLMAGGIAHNFNNNLSIILGNVELSQLQTHGQEDVTAFLADAKTAILRSRDLVQQILTYGRKSAHNQVPTVLAQVIDETLKLLRATLPSTVKLEQDNKPEYKDISIMADASRIQEVLLNFCTNAVDAMHREGTIKLSLEVAELSAQDIPAQFHCSPGHYAKLSTQDSGCGIAPDMIDKIFDPFFTTKELNEGTGMGLATVKGIIEQHQGLIKVKSTPGEGSIFELYFPLIEFRQRVSEKPIQHHSGGNERILLVDDEEMLGSVWSKMLSNFGYQVTTETSSLRALELIREKPEHYDLLVTDQTMPELTGKELAKEVMRIRPNLPIILCSGYSSRIREEEAEHLGIKGLLMKPLDLQELLQEVRRVLAGKMVIKST
jgi:signal transduction histidine kinase/ActR/RegA family two-component response regulator